MPRGHAIECRICAEDPAQQFLPSPGTIVHLREPQGPGHPRRFRHRRRLHGAAALRSVVGQAVGVAATRDAARRRMRAALREYVVLGCTTAIPFLLDLLDHPAFAAGETAHALHPEHFPAWHGRAQHRNIAAIAAAIDIAHAPHAAATDGAPAAAPSPWTSLGHWRLGR